MPKVGVPVAYYNDNDPFVCQWLRNLIRAGQLPYGRVDCRPIQEVTSNDVRGHQQQHYFAGIGGWPLALSLAGWGGRPVWTASLPCQPFSVAGKGRGYDDERHLWPVFRDLVEECRPPVLFGEQVAGTAGRDWFTRVRADLEVLGYGVGAADLCAAGVGAPHIRQRLYFGAVRTDGLADSLGVGVRVSRRGEDGGEAEGVQRSNRQRQRVRPGTGDGRAGVAGGVDDTEHTRLEGQCQPGGIDQSLGEPDELAQDGRPDRMGNTLSNGPLQERTGTKGSSQPNPGRAGSDVWSDFTTIPCLDDKTRRIPTEPLFLPLVDGIPTRNDDSRMGYLLARLQGMGHGAGDARRILEAARKNREVRLKGYGNAIVPQVAAVFIRSFMDVLEGWGVD